MLSCAEQELGLLAPMTLALGGESPTFFMLHEGIHCSTQPRCRKCGTWALLVIALNPPEFEVGGIGTHDVYLLVGYIALPFVAQWLVLCNQQHILSIFFPFLFFLNDV